MTKEEIKAQAEASLVHFIRLVAPKTVLGSVHEELCRWWTRSEAAAHQLSLLPRDHQKSRMVGFRTAWWITKYPWVRILYLSATSNLAEKQLKFVKDILTSDVYRRYWPEMVNIDEGKRARWTNTEIEVDHPLRKEEGVRDPTVFTAGLTTSITGLHCDVAVLDDVVVFENAYTSEGRDKVKSQYSLLSSIEEANALEWVVGTRYDPRDLYNDMMQMTRDVFDEEGNIVDSEPIYEVFERAVEDQGDGTGQFLWPRQRRSDGKFFGFDRKILATKRAKYLDKMQFRAQYYNDPNDPDNSRISRDRFQYYDRKHLTQNGGRWFYRNERLNIFAAIDFAYSFAKRSDYTALVTVGMDRNRNIYVLDIDRFRTDKVSEYFKHIMEAHVKWDFRKIRAEVTAAQQVIATELKDGYIRPNGLALSIDMHKPTRHMGSKEERLAAILEPRYDNMSVWHYMGGNCQILEDELVSERPPHDDVKDALASAIEIAIPPMSSKGRSREKNGGIIFNERFGGVQF